MVNLLAKAWAQAGIKVIGVKTTMIISAIFAVGNFNLKMKKNREQMDGMVVFCQEV